VIVCFDTNVLVSAVATRGLCADVVNAALAEHELIIGETVLKELRQVLRQKPRLPVVAVDEMDTFLRLHAAVIGDAPVIEFPGLDENDRAVLAEAVAGKADVLITGDQDLLELDSKVAFKILSPRGFWELLRA
jgi:putative PIN family toxin of toxin-antitoxin system